MVTTFSTGMPEEYNLLLITEALELTICPINISSPIEINFTLSINNPNI